MHAFRFALGSVLVVVLVFAGLAAASALAAGEKKKCKVVTRVVKGKKKRVRVCRQVKPKPSGATTKPSPPPPPPLGARSNPVPVGAVAQGDDGWKLKVVWADPNQTEAILDAQRGDPDDPPEPPPPGSQFLLARVSVTRTDSEPASFSPYSLDLLAADGAVYDDAGPTCGTLLDELNATDVPDGATVTGDVCWELASSRVSRVLMSYTNPFTGVPTYFSLGL
jgi:hypothetical protein